MQFEVEQKFRVVDGAAVQRQLVVLGAAFTKTIVEIDRYFAHPSRDFARTDEALRIRQIGPTNLITYKGPKIDATTKTRQEIELPLPDGRHVPAEWESLLGVLGFVPVADVRKQRCCGHIIWQDTRIELAVDRVEDLGEFVELEVAADRAGVDAAKSTLQALADRLNLANSERRSYLELLLARA